MSAATILLLVNEMLALLPVIIASGRNVAGLIEAIDKVWSEASIAHDDPRFAEVAQKISAARSKLKARADALNARGVEVV